MFQRCRLSNVKNSKGFTLIELLVVMAISTIVLGAGIYTFMRQDKLIRNESNSTNLRATGRTGINELAKEIRRAGYGMPRGQGLKEAYPTYIEFLSNSDDVFATVEADVFNNATLIDIVDGNGADFAKNNSYNYGYMVLRDVQDYNHWVMLTYSSNAGGNTVTSSVGADKLFETARGLMLSKMIQYKINYNAATDIIEFWEGDGTGPKIPLVNNVSSLLFEYYTGANAAVTSSISNNITTSTGNQYTDPVTVPIHGIRKVKITMTLDSDPTSPDDTELEFTTDVNLRNMR